VITVSLSVTMQQACCNNVDAVADMLIAQFTVIDNLQLIDCLQVDVLYKSTSMFCVVELTR